MKKTQGFSVLEVLISLAIFSFIVLGTLECFIKARSYFLEMKQEHEANQAALSALDKIKTDVSQSGKGLLSPSRLKILKSINCDNNVLNIKICEQKFTSLSNLYQGQTRIFFKDTRHLKKKRKICFFDSQKGEIKEISSVGSQFCIISTPLSNSYKKNQVCIVLLRELRFYLDEKKDIIRRKVNSSPAQPLLEQASEFSCSYEDMTNLIKVKLSVKNKKEIEYESFIFPKNTAMARLLSK
ncbi:MAG: type IV pilus modification PilV family protein [Acidobacteriota bacterium]